jgi:hypothetical protein
MQYVATRCCKYSCGFVTARKESLLTEKEKKVGRRTKG